MVDGVTVSFVFHPLQMSTAVWILIMAQLRLGMGLGLVST